MTVFIFLVFAVARGLLVITIKRTQKHYYEILTGSIYFMFFYALFQFILLFLMPPYYKYNFDLQIFKLPMLFGLAYVISNLFIIFALSTGPTSLVNVIQSFSLIIPITIGIIMWNETILINHWTGLILFIIVIFIFNKRENKIEIGKKSATCRWIMASAAAAIFSGFAVTFSKQFMINYSTYFKEYLIIANLFATLCIAPFLIYFRIKKSNKNHFNKKVIKYSFVAAILANTVNIIVMLYINKFSSVYFFPLISVLSVISVAVMCRIFLKERIQKIAYVGVIIGSVALYLLGMK